MKAVEDIRDELKKAISKNIEISKLRLRSEYYKNAISKKISEDIKIKSADEKDLGVVATKVLSEVPNYVYDIFEEISFANALSAERVRNLQWVVSKLEIENSENEKSEIQTDSDLEIKEDSKESNIVSKERPRSIGDKPENKVVKRKRRTAKKKDPE